MTGEQTWIAWFADNPLLAWSAAAIGALVLVVLVVIWLKGRPFARGDVFRASRLSGGNHLFPTQVLITPSSIVEFTPRWLGREEKTIHMAHVSSVKISSGLLFSDVLIETSGGTHPIQCYGHRKRDAAAMKRLIEGYQTEYYRKPPDSPPAGAGSPAFPAPPVAPPGSGR